MLLIVIIKQIKLYVQKFHSGLLSLLQMKTSGALFTCAKSSYFAKQKFTVNFKDTKVGQVVGKRPVYSFIYQD